MIKVFDVNKINLPYLMKYQEFLKSFVENGYFIMGQNVKEFERTFANYLGVKHVITTANCGDALILSLKCAGVKPGDDVLVPVNT